MNFPKDEEKKAILIPISSGDENGDKEGAEVEEVNYLDHLQRLQAEFKNYKKRVEQERSELIPHAKSRLVLRLLPVLDDFERMLQHSESRDQVSIDGVRMIYQNLRKELKEEGLEEIEAEGKLFDPEVHEAVDVGITEPSADGKVMEVWQKGYRFGGKMLRASRVKVGRNPVRKADE